MKQLYNEGRVIGLSAYESYVRQALSSDPDADILTEREWLAASLSANNSMILKIRAGTSRGYHDYILPEGSDLCSCTWIIGSIFEGSATCNTSDWATIVDDYGRLISNTGGLHPVTPGRSADVPTKPGYLTLSDEYKAQCKEYMKIGTGIVLQPGEWTSNIYQVPLTNETDIELTTETDQVILADLSDSVAAMTFKANLAERGFIRILFNETINNDFFIILRGFSHKALMASMYGDIIGSLHPQNGDFLGPELFPWAVNILFVYNNDVMSVLQQLIDSLSSQVIMLSNKVEMISQGQSAVSVEAAQALADAQAAAEAAQDAMRQLLAVVEELQYTQDVANRLAGRVSNLSDDVSGLSSNVSSLSSDVSTLSGDVAAIEGSTGDLDQDIQNINRKIGNLNVLPTTDKTNLVAAISETYSETTNALLIN